MDHKTWHTVDKSGWGAGPWQDEPDKEQWPDPATGFACLLKRNPSGALCGYVGVPQGHPWHGSGYSPGYDDELNERELPPALKLLHNVSVHGGLTYADACQEGDDGETICHVAAPGEPEPLWWFGFDCAHAWDLSPARAYREMLGGFMTSRDETYRTADYVKAECASLAASAAAAAELVST